jgi:hypothetical protein
MNALWKRLLAAGLLLLLAGPAWADTLALSVDVPVSYSFSESALKADKASGAIIGISLPLLIGIGAEAYKVTGTVSGTTQAVENKVTMLDVFFDAPVPVIDLRLGAGIGRGQFDTPPGSDSFDTATMTQLFVSLGYPFLKVFDVHVGYHAIGGKAKDKATNADLNVGARMVTLGLKVGF